MTITEFAEDLFSSCKSEPCEDDKTVNLHITKIKKHISDFSDLNEDKDEHEVGTQMSLPDDDDELSKAIQNLEEITDEEDNIAYNLEPEQWMNIASCEKRAAYNRQLVSWLRELKKRRKRDDT